MCDHALESWRKWRSSGAWARLEMLQSARCGTASSGPLTARRYCSLMKHASAKCVNRYIWGEGGNGVYETHKKK